MATDERYRRQISATESQIEAFARALERVLERGLGPVIDELSDDNIEDIEHVVQTLGSLDAALREAGLEDVLARINAIHGEELGLVRETFESLGFTEIFSSVDRTALEQLMTYDVEQVRGKVSKFQGDLRTEVMRSVFLGEKIVSREVLDGLTPKFAAQVEAELNTALSGFFRATTLRKAEDLELNKFLYVGPLDQVTRPFCRPKVGKTFSRAEVDGWRNGTTLDARVYLGGYNCRHRLRPVHGD